MLIKHLILLFIVLRINSHEHEAVLILARGGSKGIHLKNLRTVGGLSLLARAILTAKRAGFSDVTVSTDHPLLALESLKCKYVIRNLKKRSKITAADWAPSIWGVAEFLDKRTDINTLILLQATSPFIQAEHLRKAVQKLNVPIPYDCIFSATRSFKLRWHLKNGKLYSTNFKSGHRPRRQDWNGDLLETGAFYITRRFLLLQNKLQNQNCSVWEVTATESLEIDTYHDLEVANVLLKSNLI